MYTPFGGWYHATKHALEGLSDCLRMELEPFGVNVVVVEPGGIKTEWGEIAAAGLERTSGAGAYADDATEVAAGMRRTYEGDMGSDPQVIADTVLRAVTARRPRTRYAVGFGAKPSIALRWALPDRAFDAVIGRVMRSGGL